MSSVILFPFKMIYFFVRWVSYIVVLPFGIYSLLRRHGKKRRENFRKDFMQILRGQEKEDV